MKKSIRYSAAVILTAVLLSGCSFGSRQESSTQPESQINSAASEEQESSKAAQEISAEENSDSLTSSEQSSKTEKSSETKKTAEIGAGDIKTKEPDSNNAKLSAGSYDIKVGSKTVKLSGAFVVDGTEATIDGGTWNSTSSDENVFLVINGGKLTLKNAVLKKTGMASKNDSTRTSDVSDDYNFYGLNSVVLVVGESSSADIQGCTIESDCSGANAVFSLDSSRIDVSNISIKTNGNSSRGVYATYGGIINADHLDITTTGAHCAPVATDRGGGYVTIKNSNLTSSGDGSPNIYSTGEINAENCVGVSTGAQAAVIEGKNSITLTGCDFTVSGSGNNGMMLYQSMSGDASDSDATASVSTLTMTNTKINCQLDAPMFYITNTKSVINLSGGNSITTVSGNLVNAAAGRWGSDGSNGGNLTLNISGESYSDSIIADDISSVTVNLTLDSAFTGETSGKVGIQL